MRTLRLAFLLLLSVAAACGSASAGLPTRAFVVQGGTIAIQAGVMQNPDVQPMPFGKLRYPTRYFITIFNETGAPAWVDVEWQFPGKKASLQKSNQVQPAKSYNTWFNTFGVIDSEPINLRCLVYSDAERTKQIGSEATFMRFDKLDKEAFLKGFSNANTSPLISGWPEMGAVADSVPGTLADTRLQGDIQMRLWKEESTQHRDCKHEMVRAEGALLEKSETFHSMQEADSAAAARLLAGAQAPTQAAPVRIERWLVKSCESLTTYEVLLLPASDGGTDIGVRRVRDEPADGH